MKTDFGGLPIAFHLTGGEASDSRNFETLLDIGPDLNPRAALGDKGYDSKSGGDLCSQPTISRWENAPTLREIIRLTYALVDIWCRSYQKPPRSVVLDIDDTVVVVHGHQQLAQWNAHYDERCFLPIHVYDAATGAPVTVILRPGKTPSGVEVRKLLSRLRPNG